MKQEQIGNWAIVALGAINVLLWIITNPTALHDESLNNWPQRIGEVFSTTAMVLMTCTVILATRPRFLEPFFGGLDRMYRAHKRTSLTALILLLGHFAIIPKDDFFTLGSYLGIVALLGMLTLVVLTLAPRLPLPLTRWGLHLPYHQWKLTHKFVGFFFFLGLLHSFNVEHLTQESAAVDLYARGLGYVGVAIYAYRVVLQGFFTRTHAYTVEAVRRLNGNTAEVTLKPQKSKLNHRAGQFLFIHFPNDPTLKEPHPFTISSAPHEDHLRLSIKASGDFTQRLHATLQPNIRAAIEGPYGRFNYRAGARRQVWVAGGIGITPFLSWIRSFDGSDGYEIDLYYTVRTKDEALFWDEIAAASGRNGHFKAHLFCSNNDGRLTVAKIAARSGALSQAEVYLCGPIAMTESLATQFEQAGVPEARIHYEEFNFR